MAQKQHQAEMPKQVQQQARRPDLMDEKEEMGGKRPFAPHLPSLIQRAAQSPQSITPDEAAHLQRTVGNQALGRMLRVQAKLTLGPVSDRYEQEADTVAKQVVQNINAPKPKSVQRQEEDEELQAKPFTLNLPHFSFLQRKEEDEEELQMKPATEGGAITSGLESQIQSAKGGGRPLSTNTQASMGNAFNADFSGVRIHTGSQSNQLNQSIQARAFTTGRDIFFRDGAYNPDKSAGQELLAHELTHTIQQGASPHTIQPARQPETSRSPFLLGGLGFISPAHIQRARALSKNNQPTYQAETGNADRVRSGRLYGKRKAGHTLGRYTNFDVEDTPATNDDNYYKITSPTYQGEFVYESDHWLVENTIGTHIVTANTHIKTGSNTQTDWEEARPGDSLRVSGRTGEYYIALNRRTNTGKTGSISQDKVVTLDPELYRRRREADEMDDAAVTEKGVPFYQPPLGTNRRQSVGVDGVDHVIWYNGESLKVDFAAAGIDPDGEKSLVTAVHNGIPGYVKKEQVRKVSDTTGALQQEYQDRENDPNAQLTRITTDRVVTHSTKLRQPQQDGDKVTFKSSYAMRPGDVLKHTAESRTVFKADRMWATEMKWRGDILGMVDVEKSMPLPNDEQVALHLDTPIIGAKNRNTLEHVLVTEDTHLRKIGARRHTFAVGQKIGVELKKDSSVYVDFSIKGVDEQFNNNWIFAQMKNDAYGYIREEKVVSSAKEGVVNTARWQRKGKWSRRDKTSDVEGSIIPDDRTYIYKKNKSKPKRGDRLVRQDDQSVATSAYYYNLRNSRTGDNVSRVAKDDVVLDAGTLTNDDQPNKTAVILSKAHLRQQIENRTGQHNSGVTNNKVGDALNPGDNLHVNFGATGVHKNGNTEWYYARKGTHTGYIRAASIRESAVGQLQDVQQDVNLDRYVPAYVSGKTHLRDQNNKKREKLRTGDQIQVNFTHHPAPRSFGEQADRWFQIRRDNNQRRYIREHKVTIQFSQPKNEPPTPQSGKQPKIVYDAFKLLSGGVLNTSFNLGFRPIGGLYEGIKGVRGMEEDEHIEEGFFKNPDEGPQMGIENHSLAIAGVTGGLLGLLGTVEGLVGLFGRKSSIKQRLLAALKIGESGLSGVAFSAWATSSIYSIKGQEDSSGANLADDVVGWAFGIANAIKAIKGLFLSVYSFFTSRKKVKEKVVGSLKQVLEAGLAGVKAAKFIAGLFEHSSAHGLAVSVPFIGLAVDMASIIMSAFKTHGGRMAGKMAKRHLQNDTLKQNVVNAFINEVGLNRDDPRNKGDADHLFWKEKRGVRSINTAFRKTSYLRINPKILFALRNREQLDKRGLRSNQVHERSPRYISSDYYQIVDNDGNLTGSVAVIINNQHIEITPAAEKAIREYELVSKVKEVSKKKKIYGIEGIEKGIINLIGDVLNMGGPTAMAGAITKGVTAAIDSGFNFARFINKQMDNRSGKKIASHLKYQGTVKGTDKSKTKKQREYYDHAIFIMQEIGELATPTQIIDAAQDQAALDRHRQTYSKVQDHVKMTGVYTRLFYDSAGKPKEQVNLLVEALGER